MRQIHHILPEHIQTRLQRWYLFSCGAFALVLILCSIIYTCTIIQVHALRRTLQQQKIALQPTAHPSTSKLPEQLARHRAEHLHLYELLQQLLNGISLQTYFTRLTLEPYGTITCQGVTHDTNTLTDLLHLLQTIGYGNVTQLITEPPAAENAGRAFTIRVSYSKASK